MRISDWSSDVCSSDLPQEIVEHLVTVLGGDAFRVELHAMDGQIAVTHAHDEAVGAGRVHHQRIRQAFRLDDQRVIARRGEGRGKAREYAGCVMADVAGLSCHMLLYWERVVEGKMEY